MYIFTFDKKSLAKMHSFLINGGGGFNKKTKKIWIILKIHSVLVRWVENFETEDRTVHCWPTHLHPHTMSSAGRQKAQKLWSIWDQDLWSISQNL